MFLMAEDEFAETKESVCPRCGSHMSALYAVLHGTVSVRVTERGAEVNTPSWFEGVLTLVEHECAACGYKPDLPPSMDPIAVQVKII